MRLWFFIVFLTLIYWPHILFSNLLKGATMYIIKQNGNEISRKISLPLAISTAEKAFGLTPRTNTSIKPTNKRKNTQINTRNKSNISNSSTQVTVSVEDLEGQVLASLSTGRIIGEFIKEKWSDVNRGKSLLDTVAFDATDYVLLMQHEEIIELEDGTEESDEIGAAHISWSGPCDVVIASAVCAFFGVETVENITRENLEYVRSRMNPQAATEVDVSFSVSMKLRVAAGQDATDFVNGIDWNLFQTAAGVIVRSAEVSRN